MKRSALVITMGLFTAGLSMVTPVQAMTVTQLELTGGAVNYEGKHHQVVDRLLGQHGIVKLGQYQSIGEIVPTISKGSETYSLFTSGFSGAAAPSATISGSSIKVDLSSLFFGSQQGNSYQVWNIGRLATGLYNPETREFALSWTRLFDGNHNGHSPRFFLTGVVKFDPQPVAVPAAMVLYATGAFGVSAWTYWRRRDRFSVTA